MDAFAIIELIALIAIVAVSITYYLVKIIKNKWYKQIVDTTKLAVKEAEQSGKSGKEKLQFVLNKVANECEVLGIPFKRIRKMVIVLVETIVAGYNAITK